MSTTRARLEPWFIVFMLTLFMILAFADRAVLGFAAVPLMRDLNLTPSQFGLAASAMYWVYPVAGIAGGFLVNRCPTKWVLAGLAAIWAASQFPMLWATSLNEIVAARVLLGLGEGPAFAVVLLTAANGQLALFHRDVELVPGKSRDRQRDPQPVGPAVLAGNPLDIVGRIAVGGLADPIEYPLELVEAEQERRRKGRHTRHGRGPRLSDIGRAPKAPSAAEHPATSRIWRPAWAGSRLGANGE